MYCDLYSQYIQVRKLFKGGNCMRKYGIYSRPVVPRGALGTPRFWQISYIIQSQPGKADYAQHITTGTPRFSYYPTALTKYI